MCVATGGCVGRCEAGGAPAAATGTRAVRQQYIKLGVRSKIGQCAGAGKARLRATLEAGQGWGTSGLVGVLGGQVAAGAQVQARWGEALNPRKNVGVGT